MRTNKIFQSIVEPTLERVAVIEVLHVERHEGSDFVVSHVLRRNIFTDFDKRLSRHLAAVRGGGFPTVTATVRVRDRREKGAWQTCPSVNFASIPHALATIARRAIGTADSATLRLHYRSLDDDERETTGLRRVIERNDLQILETALKSCEEFGEPAFLEITGDFDLVMIKPPAPELKAIVMDLFQRRLTIPPVPGITSDHVSVPLFDFQKVIAENTEARTYMAALRQSMMAQKEQAVLDFRAAAEARILAFESALRGRRLDGFRLDTVISLVARLKSGLGDGLSGLSEDAQITAFDWATAIDRGAQTQGYHAPFDREPLPEEENRRDGRGPKASAA
ncbi:MAG: hypothetical protein AAGC57_19655 [Pseudomonadota bacterium]